MTKQTQSLSIGGMSCQHCVRTVKTSVEALKGVAAADVSLEKNLLTVAFDPGLVSLEAIKTAIEDQGYTVA